MTTKTLITLVLLVGFVVSAPVLLWGLGDLAGIPSGVWRHSAQRPRRQWRASMISAYAFGGWPVIVSVLLWRHSPERANLLDEWAHLSDRKRRSRARAREAARLVAEHRAAEPGEQARVVPWPTAVEPARSEPDAGDRVIVFSDHEDA